MSKSAIGEIIKDWYSNAYLLAEIFSIQLDDSESSVESLEYISGRIYRMYSKINIENIFMKIFRRKEYHSDLYKASKIIGSYLGFIIVENFGGRWDVTENKHISVILKTKRRCFPIQRAYDRLINGSSENLVEFYKELKEEVRSFKIR